MPLLSQIAGKLTIREWFVPSWEFQGYKPCDSQPRNSTGRTILSPRTPRPNTARHLQGVVIPALATGGYGG